MRVADIIRKKRDGAELTRAEIRHMVDGYARDEVPDYQVSAWLMALFLQGVSPAELAALTDAMLHSGEVLDFSDLPACKVDKHSTGGVGDKTSLVIAPVAAAGGLYVPMISGRGLGHTGGTLDKLESIPGFNVNLSLADFRRTLEACGCALIGQTASKKLAEGIDALVLDVKTGSGAFMKDEEDAAALAGLMVETGARMGKQVVALITDMDQPLGRTVGNALEVAECIDVLRGGGPADLRTLCVELAGWMFCLGRRASGVEEGKRLASEILASGKGLEKFREIIRLQGGDPRVTEDPNRLPQAPLRTVLASPTSGHVAGIACEQIGVAGILLGGGRERKEDVVDPAVGMVVHKKIGDRVHAGEPLMTVHYRDEARLRAALALLEGSYRLAEDLPGRRRPLVRRVIDGRSSSGGT
jgi:thymidine phosphorylase